MWLLPLLICYICLLSLCFFTKRMYVQSENNIQNNSVHYFVNKSSVYLFLCFSFFVFFSTFRYPKFGTDTYSYLLRFININTGTLDLELSFTNEWAYTLLNKIVGSIFLNYQFFLFIISLFIFISFAKFIQKSSNCVWLSLLLFVSAGYLDTCMSLIRFSIALSIILYSYKYIQKRKLVKFVCLVFLASLFHVSAWITLFAYIIFNIGNTFINKRMFLIYLFSVILIIPISNHFLSFIFNNIPVYNYYENNEVFGVQDSAKLAPTLELIINLCVIIYARSILKLYDTSKRDLFYYNLLLFSTYFLALSTIFTPIGRIAKYFSIGLIVLLPNVCMQLKNKRNRFILITLIISCFATKYVVISFLRPEWTAVYPYKFFFEH